MQKSAGADLRIFATRKEEEMMKMKCIVYILQFNCEEKKLKNVKQFLNYEKMKNI